MNEYTALGLMSGSSLDGVDLTFCHFFEEGQSWHYHIEVAETIAYNEVWKQFLMESLHVSAEELPARDVKFGNYLGKLINDFLKRHNLKPDLIALHGHTLFHQPKQGFSFQLGSGQAIAIKTGIETISDFRNKDILLGGQGAPLVPIGDTQLFADYDFCLNIGGIANISFDVNGIRKALDVCPANQLLNHLSELMGEPYDKGGKMSRKGRLNFDLFDLLNRNSFYKLDFPKSLNNETVRTEFIPLVDKFEASVQDKLHTVVKHIAFQIAQTGKRQTGKRMLVTGGGAHNNFLLDSIRKAGSFELIIPEEQLIDFKEALIFAFMGTLRHLGRNNCLASATGARQNSSVGNIFYP